MRVGSIVQVSMDRLFPLASISHHIRFQARFHPVLGPILMVTYACLSNTLLLTGKLCFISTASSLMC
jgi:hypothetical protein